MCPHDEGGQGDSEPEEGTASIVRDQPDHERDGERGEHAQRGDARAEDGGGRGGRRVCVLLLLLWLLLLLLLFVLLLVFLPAVCALQAAQV